MIEPRALEAEYEAGLHERESIAALAVEVGVALTRGGPLVDILGECTRALVGNLEAAFARIWVLNEETAELELRASSGLYTHLDGPHGRVPVGKFKIGLIALERQPHLTNFVIGDPRVGDQEWARREGMVSFAGYPLMVEDHVVGVMAMFARRPLSDAVLRAMETISFGIALSIRQKQDEAALRVSERRKAAIFDSALDCILTLDPDGRILEFNSAAARTFGLDRDQAAGRLMVDRILSPEFRDAFRRDVREGRAEVTAMRSNGSAFPAEITYFQGPTEGAALIIVFLRDITERRDAERERDLLLARAEAAQRSYRELAEVMPQQVWTARPDGQLAYVNQRGIEYFNSSSAELLGAGWVSVIHPDDVTSVVERWTECVETGAPYEVEFRLRRGIDCMYRWHLGRSMPVRDSSGAIVRWLGTNTDIDDRKRAEHEMVAAKAEADAANQAKSQFLASMSHELRTPLNAVIGYSEMLEEQARDVGAAEFVPDLRKIRRAGGYLLNLINNVLDLAKIESGKMDVYLEEFRIDEMIADVTGTIQPLVERNSNELIVHCPHSIGLLTSDLTKVRQCLLNLLSNAAKFTDHGTITLEVERYGATIRFRVIDTGIGLSPDQARGLFEPFAQAHPERAALHGGTGLGLAITRSFCQLLGGDVTLESEVGRGSTFTISLPV